MAVSAISMFTSSDHMDDESIALAVLGSWPGLARSRSLPAQATARYKLDLPVSEALI